ncbi:MAG: L,D-transpeptidase family protein [Gemmatimonadetes bacterium]|nr:L,D-transpeptidase family protein [Gemmatimonadota bacterium]
MRSAATLAAALLAGIVALTRPAALATYEAARGGRDGSPERARQLRTAARDTAAYPRLEYALARYQELATRGGWPTVPAGTVLRPGDADDRIPVLRARLLASGDLAASAAGTDPGALTFAAELEGAVRVFQARHGLEVDGTVGRATLAALNVSAEERVRQIELNLRRWREVSPALDRPFVLVNIPAFELMAFERGREALRMRVAVGRRSRPTPSLAREIQGVVFNPYWEVPRHLAIEDILPVVRRNPGYLTANRFRVFEQGPHGEQEIDPATVDWQSVTTDDFAYRFRQEPGGSNPMGRVKFLFPNGHYVFLHDFPQPQIFSQRVRALSSGCVRLEQPLALAAFLLQDQPELTRDALLAALTGQPEASLRLARPVPIHLVYLTAWADESGSVHFRPDIYGGDTGVRLAADGTVFSWTECRPASC